MSNDGVSPRAVAGGIGRRALRHCRADQRATAGRLMRGSSAQPADAFQRHVAGAVDGPLVVLFEQDCADEADDGVVVGEDADHIGSPL